MIRSRRAPFAGPLLSCLPPVHRARWGGGAFLVGAAALVFACSPPSPPQPPTPPEPPQPGPKFVEMLLRADGAGAVQTIAGEPVHLQGAISCCMDADWAPDARTGWPCNIHPSWQDYAAETFDANLFHCRLGPFIGAEWAEPEWADIGGPYVQDEEGRADLTQWNEPFWDQVVEYVEYAAERGRYVEVDLIDGWYCKHGQWGDVKMPWMPQWNIQGEAWVARCGSEEIVPGTVFDVWLRKVATELGPYGNVIWEDGNEIGQVPGYTPAWTLSMRDRMREYERDYAYNVVHLFGTNSGRDDVRPRVDYVEEHRTRPLEGPIAGKPSMVNEYNPRPPFGAVRMNDYRCFAESNGTWWWYWRHGQSLEQMEQTGALYREPCGVAPPPPKPCRFPQGVPDEDFVGGPTSTVLGTEVNAALERVTGCAVGTDCALGGAEEFYAAVTADLRARGLCAGRHDDEPPGASDEIAVATACTSRWESYHVYNFGGSKVVWSPNAARPSYTIDPKWCDQPPPPVSDCPIPDSCGAKFSLGPHQGVIDSTYTVTSCCDYCASIGMGEYNGQPRCGCPVLPEGHPDRPKLERACIGIQRWWCNGIELERCGATRNPNCITANPAQAICSGRVRTCTADLSTCSEGDF